MSFITRFSFSFPFQFLSELEAKLKRLDSDKKGADERLKLLEEQKLQSERSVAVMNLEKMEALRKVETLAEREQQVK